MTIAGSAKPWLQMQWKGLHEVVGMRERWQRQRAMLLLPLLCYPPALVFLVLTLVL